MAKEPELLHVVWELGYSQDTAIITQVRHQTTKLGSDSRAHLPTHHVHKTTILLSVPTYQLCPNPQTLSEEINSPVAPKEGPSLVFWIPIQSAIQEARRSFWSSLWSSPAPRKMLSTSLPVFCPSEPSARFWERSRESLGLEKPIWPYLDFLEPESSAMPPSANLHSGKINIRLVFGCARPRNEQAKREYVGIQDNWESTKHSGKGTRKDFSKLKQPLPNWKTLSSFTIHTTAPCISSKVQKAHQDRKGPGFVG